MYYVGVVHIGLIYTDVLQASGFHALQASSVPLMMCACLCILSNCSFLWPV